MLYLYYLVAGDGEVNRTQIGKMQLLRSGKVRLVTTDGKVYEVSCLLISLTIVVAHIIFFLAKPFDQTISLILMFLAFENILLGELGHGKLFRANPDCDGGASGSQS